jgi:hypothetical protein
LAMTPFNNAEGTARFGCGEQESNLMSSAYETDE